MKNQRKLTNKEWAEIVALGHGVRMYRNQKTLFWNGELLYDADSRERDYLIYDDKERNSWKVIIILPGAEVIPDSTFRFCRKVKTVIMADTIRRIEAYGFSDCWNLRFITLSRNLEFIGDNAFYFCRGLYSIFIPPSCREIQWNCFLYCEKLIILHVPRNTDLGLDVMTESGLDFYCPFQNVDEYGNEDDHNPEINEWIKNINGDTDEYALHRACSSFNPIAEIIIEIINRQGLKAFRKKNEIGVTPAGYLEENPFADMEMQKLINRYVLEMMGEVV